VYNKISKIDIILRLRLSYFLLATSNRLFVFSLKVTGDGANKKLFEPKQWKHQRAILNQSNKSIKRRFSMASFFCFRREDDF